MTRKEYAKEYYKKNKERREAYNYKNRERIKERRAKYNLKNKKMIALLLKNRRIARINSWRGYIPQEANCEVCGKKIFFKGHSLKETIHFDHKHENCVIQKIPAIWMSQHFRTEENQKIWESCEFGYLCARCNLGLPTKNRKEWIRKVVEYVNKKLL